MAQNMSKAELEQALASALARAESAEQEAKEAKAKGNGSAGKLTFKVSPKGALSVYGLGRFPVTLYKGQWDRLDAQYAELRAFRKQYDSRLASKA